LKTLEKLILAVDAEGVYPELEKVVENNKFMKVLKISKVYGIQCPNTNSIEIGKFFSIESNTVGISIKHIMTTLVKRNTLPCKIHFGGNISILQQESLEDLITYIFSDKELCSHFRKVSFIKLNLIPVIEHRVLESFNSVRVLVIDKCFIKVNFFSCWNQKKLPGMLTKSFSQLKWLEHLKIYDTDLKGNYRDLINSITSKRFRKLNIRRLGDEKFANSLETMESCQKLIKTTITNAWSKKLRDNIKYNVNVEFKNLSFQKNSQLYSSVVAIRNNNLQV
jgi:hypothetical protein